MITEMSPEAVNAGKQWFQESIEANMPNGGWEPRALNELCKKLEGRVQHYNPLAEFGARAAQLECDVLLQHCLEQAGYSLASLRPNYSTIDTRSHEEM
jgi:hypothetical protein